jgi:oligopeptidase B
MGDRAGEVTAFWATRGDLLDAVQRCLGDVSVTSRHESLPVRRGGFRYFRRSGTGQYAVHLRSAPDGTEQVVLDPNLIAGDGYFRLGGFQVSPDSRLLAYTADRSGDERFGLHVRDIGEGVDAPARRIGTGPAVAWAAGSDAVFYQRRDPAGRPSSIWRLALGGPPEHDRLILAEPDPRYELDVALAKSGRWLFVTSLGPDSSAVYILPASDPQARAQLLVPRQGGQVCYAVHAAGPEVFVLTKSDDHCWITGVRPGTPAACRRVADGAGRATIDEIDATGPYLIVCETAESLPRLRLIDTRSGSARTFVPPLPQAAIALGANPRPNAATYRFSYSSLSTPRTFADYRLSDGHTAIVRADTPDGYRPEDYIEQRLWAHSADGTPVPMAVVRHRSVTADGTAPGLLVTYGAYGLDIDMAFMPFRQVLLAAGFVFAIAYVRGGGAFGPRWHAAGRGRHKPNAIADLVACARHLVATGLVAPSRLAGRGFSAAGALFGAAINAHPGLFAAIALHAPFVDVLAGVTDAAEPVTAAERTEWGDPTDPAELRCIRSYSPVLNISPQPYPGVWATAATDDPRVPWRQVADWAQQVRAASTSGRPVLLRLTGGGHSGPTGRASAATELAMTLAFLCDMTGVAASRLGATAAGPAPTAAPQADPVPVAVTGPAG